MKKKIQKIIWIVLMILLIMNVLGNVVFASNTTVVNEIAETTEEESVIQGVFDGLGMVLDGLVGILTLTIRLPILLIIMAIHGIITGITALGGTEMEGILTPDDIFNKVGLTNIDFFDFSGNIGAIQTIRINVATWYYILRILAIVILLVVLIYVGIRMAISTVASEQAQYKKMLTDWVVSFALIFLLNYIIIFTIEANNALVGLLEYPVRTKIGMGITTQLITRSVVGVATVSWGSLIVYAMLIGMTTAFLFTYIKRMLTIGFLIIISPLITITYSIDRAGDGKAQALNNWLKEFMFTVLIQPFHCIIYIVFVSSAIDLLSWEGSIPKMVLAIMCMAFIWKAEKIVKTIFGFDGAKASLGDTVASMAAVKAIGSAATKMAGTGSKAASKTSFGKNISNKVSNTAPGKAFNKISNSGIMKKTEGFMKSKVAPIAVGAVAAGFEKGLNSSANAAQVGAEAATVAHAWLNGGKGEPGSKESKEKCEKDLERFSKLLSKNDNFNFENYTSNDTSKNNLKGYTESLIGANMDLLNSNIQKALNDLGEANSAEYNLITPEGMTNFKDLQDMALEEDLDFSNPATHPLGAGHTWSPQEKQVVTAIQIRNQAQAVQALHEEYKAEGYSDPMLAVDDYIQSL